MITYKDITEVNVLQQASENTKVLVNEGGELMQAPYSNFEDKINSAEVVEGIPVGATALINDSNKLKQIPLAVLDYNNLTNVGVMEQVSENSMAIVNDGGVIKQVSCGSGFGGKESAHVTIDNNANLVIFDPTTESTSSRVTDRQFSEWFNSGNPIIYHDGSTSGYIIGYYFSLPATVSITFADGIGGIKSRFPYITFEGSSK